VNVESFLMAARKLGVPESSLFTVSDLTLGIGMEQVTLTPTVPPVAKGAPIFSQVAVCLRVLRCIVEEQSSPGDTSGSKVGGNTTASEPEPSHAVAVSPRRLRQDGLAGLKRLVSVRAHCKSKTASPGQPSGGADVAGMRAW
jgi:hypothetical protein